MNSGLMFGRARGLALAATLIVAACGGATSTAPVATPTATPMPTSTPFDVGAAFLEIVAGDGGDGINGRIEISGTLELGVTAELSGSIDSAGGNSRMELTNSVGSNTSTTETVTIDGDVYTRTETFTCDTEIGTIDGNCYMRTTSGPWLRSDPTASSGGDDFSAWLRSLDSVEDLGVVTKNGQSLHHLKPDKPLPDTAFFGAAVGAAEDPSISIEMYAKDDGTPALFTIAGTWTQDINGQAIHVEMTLDMTFSMLGEAATVRAPTDIWTTYESPLGYTMAHPEAFTVANHDAYDAYLKDSEEWFYVTVWPEATGLSADGFRDGVIETYVDDYGQPLDGPKPYALAGEPGWSIFWQYALDNGETAIVVDVVAMHANFGWEITLVTSASLQGADIALLNMALTTFTYPS